MSIADQRGSTHQFVDLRVWTCQFVDHGLICNRRVDRGSTRQSRIEVGQLTTHFNKLYFLILNFHFSVAKVTCQTVMPILP